MRARLRSIVAGSVLVLITGCGEDGHLRLPTSPAPQPPPSAAKGFIWGHVVDESGKCLIDAVVEIVEGPNVGQRFVQKDVCSVWDGIGYTFNDLPLGVPIRVRATKEGHRTVERQVAAFTTGQGIDIVLVRE